MPSNRRFPIIPASAKLDPGFCSEFGRPQFAWHINAGRINAGGGGGVLLNRGGLVGARSTAGTGVTYQNGAARFDGASGTRAEFSGTESFAVGAGVAVTFFVIFEQIATAALSQVIMQTGGNAGAGFNRLDGYGISLSGTQLIQIGQGNGASQNVLAAGGPINLNQIYSYMGVFTNQTSGSMIAYVDGGPALITQATSIVPAYALGKTVCLANYGVSSLITRPLNARIYCAFGWIGKAQPQALARMLTGNPAIAWTWQGKDIRRQFSFAPDAAGSAFHPFFVTRPAVLGGGVI